MRRNSRKVGSTGIVVTPGMCPQSENRPYPYPHLGSFLTCPGGQGSQKAWGLHPVLWNPVVWGVAYFPHSTVQECRQQLSPGVPHQEGLMFRGPTEQGQRDGLLSASGHDCHMAYVPRHLRAYPRWPFRRLNVGRGGLVSYPCPRSLQEGAGHKP